MDFTEEKKVFVLPNVDEIENIAISAMETIIREAIKLVANVEILSLVHLTIQEDKVSVLLALQ
jgi:hypothetical protein